MYTQLIMLLTVYNTLIPLKQAKLVLGVSNFNVRILNNNNYYNTSKLGIKKSR